MAAAATVTMAFQALFGIIGIGATVLVFVILGNPSAGGAFQPPLLPPFWRTIAYALPNGAGTDSVRRIVYFGANGIGGTSSSPAAMWSPEPSSPSQAHICIAGASCSPLVPQRDLPERPVHRADAGISSNFIGATTEVRG